MDVVAAGATVRAGEADRPGVQNKDSQNVWLCGQRVGDLIRSFSLCPKMALWSSPAESPPPAGGPYCCPIGLVGGQGLGPCNVT